jgi:flagellar export protein FliJ
MSPFRYRLQKVLELREKKLKAQELEVVKAQDALRLVDKKIQAKRDEIRGLYQQMQGVPAQMFEVYDRYIYKLHDDLEDLQLERQYAEARLKEERQKLVQAQADVEALQKHKESAKEVWLEEEKARELKQMDEIAGQRYFRDQQSKLLEELQEQQALQAQEALEEAARTAAERNH